MTDSVTSAAETFSDQRQKPFQTNGGTNKATHRLEAARLNVETTEINWPLIKHPSSRWTT
jgi:hypothetical protein